MCATIRLLIAALVFLPVAAVLAQGTLRYNVTFDKPPISRGVSTVVDEYLENPTIQGLTAQRVWFRPTDQRPSYLGRDGGGIAGFPENGTTFLNAFTTLAISLRDNSFREGAHFAVYAVDLAEYSTLFQTPTLVSFTGYLADGSTVSTSFTTDGIMDGTGPLQDFQTFQFDSRFYDIVRLECPPTAWAMDNLLIGNPVAVPEPSSALLLLPALLLLSRRSRQPAQG